MALEKAQEGNIESIVQGIQLLSKYQITTGDVYNEVNYLAGKAHQDNGEYQSAIVNFANCSGYKDANNLYKACSYNYALTFMEQGNLEKAIVYLIESKGYNNSDKLLKLCQKYLEFTTKKWVIPEGEIFDFRVKINKKGKVSIYNTIYKCKYKTNIIKWNDDNTKYELNIRKLKIRKKQYVGLFLDDDWIEESVIKIDANAEYSELTDEEELEEQDEIDLSKLPEKPVIGMTEDEACHTQWGDPNNINVTETASGIHKQLCFGSGRYAYTFNGSVTSIQY